MKSSPILFLLVVALTVHAATPAVDPVRMREQVAALGQLTQAPAVHPAEGFTADGSIRPLFFEGLPWKGQPARVFAWMGLPEGRTGKVPGVVLVHGGGGTAFKEWVKKWNDQGFAAIAMGLEGQTDERLPGAPPGAQWKRHAAGGPPRQGIYGDSAEPLADQWMYHAVADVVLAHSLLRAQPEVDPTRIGVCGISWGGIITATVVGIDGRFAFGIPIYGCGALDRAPNQYGRALQDNAVYREVWEPLLRLPHAKLPLLWLTGPRDSHFPLEVQQASYRAAPGPRMVAVPFEMKHSHPAGWNPPDSYTFAKSIVETGRPWAREVTQAMRDGTASVDFEVTRPIGQATLVFKRDADWEQAPATLEKTAGGVRASATLPGGTTAYFFNLAAAGLTLSSELQTVTAVAPPRKTAAFPGFSWDRVPLNIHFGKRTGDRAVVAGLREMVALTKRKLGPDRLVLVNGLRTTDFREILDWEGIDGVMIEHFGGFKTDSPSDSKADLDSFALAAAKGKFVVLKGWPGFNWLDPEMMKRPYAELLQLARERITFPLACFLVAAQPGSHFCYSWGYTHSHGMLDAYPEFDRPLGPPQADAVWQGLTATREFAHASVWVDLAPKQARIDWR